MTIEPYKIAIGNLRTPLGALIEQGGKPVNLASATVKFYMNEADGTEVVAEATTGVTAHPTNTFTAVAATDRIVHNGHTVLNGQQVVLSSTGTLPAGLATATRYFACNVTPNYFQVSLIPGGTVVDITDAGTGTHSYYVVGTVKKVFLAGDVDTAGDYQGWFTVDEGGTKDTFPPSATGIPIRIEEAD